MTYIRNATLSCRDLGIDLPKCEDEPPALWWDDDCDKSLLVGIVKHGNHNCIVCIKSMGKEFN